MMKILVALYRALPTHRDAKSRCGRPGQVSFAGNLDGRRQMCLARRFARLFLSITAQMGNRLVRCGGCSDCLADLRSSLPGCPMRMRAIFLRSYRHPRARSHCAGPEIPASSGSGWYTRVWSPPYLIARKPRIQQVVEVELRYCRQGEPDTPVICSLLLL